MVNKEFIRIINEEISNFDYLNNTKLSEQQDVLTTLQTPEFQKMFILDSISHREKIKEDVIDSRIIDDVSNDTGHFNVEYISNIEYQYENAPIKFQIYFDGHKVRCDLSTTITKGSYDVPDDIESFLTSVDWTSINVYLYSANGDEIPFTELEKAPFKIKEMFIKDYLEDIVRNNIAEFN
jgi:hypothetical protein